MGAEEDSFGKDEAAAVHTRYQIQIFIPFNNRRSDKYLNAVKFLYKKKIQAELFQLFSLGSQHLRGPTHILVARTPSHPRFGGLREEFVHNYYLSILCIAVYSLLP